MTAELLNIEAVQERLGGVGRTTVFQLIREGELAIVKIGRRTMVPSSELDDYMQRNMSKSGRPDPARNVTCKRCGHHHLCDPSANAATRGRHS